MSDAARAKAAGALEAEVQRRNEWYGLDNWSFREVVDFVCDEVSRTPDAGPAIEHAKAQMDWWPDLTDEEVWELATAVRP